MHLLLGIEIAGMCEAVKYYPPIFLFAVKSKIKVKSYF